MPWNNVSLVIKELRYMCLRQSPVIPCHGTDHTLPNAPYEPQDHMTKCEGLVDHAHSVIINYGRHNVCPEEVEHTSHCPVC